MIRFINDADFKSANKLLKELNYEISKASFNNPFFNAMCYFERDLIGVLVFKELYERIEIEYIVVDKVNRSRKVASKLMDFLIGYAHNKQIENISLEVNVNNLKAINLYKKYEFKIVAKGEKYYNNEDAYLMVRRLI